MLCITIIETKVRIVSHLRNDKHKHTHRRIHKITHKHTNALTCGGNNLIWVEII